MKKTTISGKRYFTRITAFMLVILLLSGLFSTTVSAVEKSSFDDSNIQTETLLLIDTDSDKVLYSKNSNTQVPLASVTKIMTCILAIENIKNPADKMIEIKAEPINDILNQDASTAGFENHIGETYSALDIIYGLMLPSGCEAAQILAYEIGGNEKAFVKMMNDKAKSLGCNDTLYFEAHGISDKNYTTAKDIAKITKHALTLPYFKEIVSSEYYTPSGYSYPFINTNYLIDVQNGGQYYYPYATGVKTGFTTKAGKCLVSTAQKGDDEYMCIALGGKYSSTDGYINHAMIDSVNLYKWAFKNYTQNIVPDIKNSYASIEIGDTLKLSAEITSNNTNNTPVISWSSSNEKIATVSNSGVVTAKSLGQVIITATTQTGNIDCVNVSCGFYNGIDVTSRYGDYTSGVKNPLDWEAVKNYGFDFAVIRAGWGSEDYPLQNDAEFINNVKGAFKNSIPFLLSFIAYAQSPEEAKAEADYFLREMSEYFPKDCENQLMTVVYNMTYSQFANFDTATNTEIALAFSERVKEYGYKTVINTNKTTFSKLDIDKLVQNSIGTYYNYYPYSMEFSSFITTPDGNIPQMWQYRTDGYIPEASENLNTKQSIMYMLSSFENNLTSPSLKSELIKNNEVKLSWTNYDLPANSYSIYQVSENGDKELIAKVDGNTSSYIVSYKEGGKYIYILEETLKDMLSSETITLTAQSEILSIYSPLDVNRDGSSNIMDATFIQKVISRLTPSPVNFDSYADVNGDGEVTVSDATYIQKQLVNLQ